MSIAPRRTYSLEDSPVAYKKALERISKWPSAIEGFAQWLLNFSFKGTESLSQKDWKNLQWEGFVFAYPYGFPTMYGRAMRSPPSITDLIEMQRWVGSLWNNLQKGEMSYIESNNWVAELYAENDRIVGFARPVSSSWQESFKLELFQVITAKDLNGRFRFCKSELCLRPFLSIKRQIFCSPACSQYHRTTSYRSKNRERFREKRREYYKKIQRARTGSPNLRIQTRKGVGP